MVKHHLEYYATQFDTAELNGVFYRTPTTTAVRDWRKRTPDDFLFAWKASKFITHWKRLGKSSRSSFKLMETRLRLLGAKAGPVLFQLPPNFQCDYERLARFIDMLNSKRNYAFEFRHASWYSRRIFRLLADHDVSLCVSDHADAPAPMISSPCVYSLARARGPIQRALFQDSTRSMGDESQGVATSAEIRIHLF